MLEQEKVKVESESDHSSLLTPHSSGLKSQHSGFSPSPSPFTPPSHFHSPPSLLVVGLDSMIGSALMQEAEARGIPCQGTSRRPGARWHLDLAATPESWQLPKNASTAILCAAETSVDKCDKNPAATKKINTTSAIDLADRLAAIGTQIVFLSTSRVFPPWIEFPDECTAPQPSTAYGRQKLAVEEHLLRHHPSAKIIRLSKIISPTLPLFSSWRKALANGTCVQAYSDLFLSAVALRAAADAILQIALSSTRGILHISALDALSYLDAARFLANLEGVDPSLIQPLPSPQPNTPESTILRCSQTMETTSFRPSTSLENLRSAFSGLIQ